MTTEEFENIVPELRPLMVQIGRYFFGNQDDAEDVAQESLLRLWNYCARLDAHRNMEALAVKVAKNVSVDLYKRRRTLTISLSEQEDVAHPEGADAHVALEETKEKLQLAMIKLSPRERQLLTSNRIEGRSTDELVEQTGIAKPSLQSILSMAKKKLLKQFNQLNE
ncbi:MAG TPA: sigma-70 family RNA polymerase sigma factor [Xylanibacter oryzae]|nr:sigma-70 family RNA polymerase sigma factor [Xylanibacter oryzae]